MFRHVYLELLESEGEVYDWSPRTLVGKFLVDSRVEDAASCDRPYRCDRVLRPKATDETTASRVSAPLPFQMGCARIVEYYVDDIDIKDEASGHAELLTYCLFELDCIRRRSERLTHLLRQQKREERKHHRDVSGRRRGGREGGGEGHSSGDNIGPPTAVCLDLTTTDTWASAIAASPDFASLPPVEFVRFNDVIWTSLREKTAPGEKDTHIQAEEAEMEEEEEKVPEKFGLVLVFRKVLPRRFIDCCYDSGRLFCYEFDAARVTRAPVFPSDDV